MKSSILFGIFISFTLLRQWNSKTEIEPSIKYLNQSLPGLKPEQFAPDVFTNKDFTLHGFPTMSPDGNDIYWPVVPPKVIKISYINGNLTLPAAADFSERNIQAPIFSYDGKRILFQMSDPVGFGSLDIWYVIKQDSGWSKKHNLGSPPNSEKMESQPTITKMGTIYFTGYYENGLLNRGIFRSEYWDGKYKEPELLPEIINSKYLDYTPFISADESYLLFSSTRPSEDEKAIRIYITFRKRDGTWTLPENLNTVMDFDKPSRFPSITPDGKFIVFLSEGQFYWVSSKIIDECNEK